MQKERVQFTNRNGQQLVGYFIRPLKNQIRAYALFAHCFTCSMQSRAAVDISEALASKGIAVLRFDFTGIGSSGGEFEETTFSSNIDDLICAADWLTQQHQAPQLMIGHSLGGTATLLASAQVDSCKAVVTLGAPFEPSHVTHLFDKKVQEIEEKGFAKVDLGGREFAIQRSFLDDLEAHDMSEVLSDLGKALLIIHSPTDSIVNIDNAAKIFQATKHPKSFLSLDGADHLISESIHSKYAATVITAWASHHLEMDASVSKPSSKHVLVRIERGGLQTAITMGSHELLADEPKGAGGEDNGPTPYELVSAGLGACTAMTLQMYAQRKEWSLEAVEVVLEHSKIHAEDCEKCETKKGKLDQISRKLKIEGDLTAEQRERLLEIANRCPVHRTLTSEIHIPTELVN